MKKDVFNVIQIALLSRINNQLSSVSIGNTDDDELEENTIKYDASNHTVRINTSMGTDVDIIYKYSAFRMTILYYMSSKDETFKTPFAKNETPRSMSILIEMPCDIINNMIILKYIYISIPSLNEDYTYTFSESDITTGSLSTYGCPRFELYYKDGIHLVSHKTPEVKDMIQIYDGQSWSDTSNDIEIVQYDDLRVKDRDTGNITTIPILDLDYEKCSGVIYEYSNYWCHSHRLFK